MIDILAFDTMQTSVWEIESKQRDTKFTDLRLVQTQCEVWCVDSSSDTTWGNLDMDTKQWSFQKMSRRHITLKIIWYLFKVIQGDVS